jgi:hypothetical protein
MIALDGTDNKGKLGANAILAVSMAIAKASRGRGRRALGTALPGGSAAAAAQGSKRWFGARGRKAASANDDAVRAGAAQCQVRRYC